MPHKRYLPHYAEYLVILSIVLIGLTSLSNVGSTSPPPPAAQSSADGKILFASNRDGNSEIYAVNPDGSGQVEPITSTNSPVSNEYPVWSPDLTRIAFESVRNNNRDIYVINANGSGLRRLTGNPGIDVHAAWSPDGTRIAYSGDQNGSRDIYTVDASSTVDANGNNPTQRKVIAIAANDPSTRPDLHPVYSPDGTKFAFASERDGVSRNIYTMNIIDGTAPRALTTIPAFDSFPVWSPDGRKIAFHSDRSGNFEIYVMDAVNGEDNTIFDSDGGRSLFKTQGTSPRARREMSFPTGRPTAPSSCSKAIETTAWEFMS